MRFKMIFRREHILTLMMKSSKYKGKGLFICLFICTSVLSFFQIISTVILT